MMNQNFQIYSELGMSRDAYNLILPYIMAVYNGEEPHEDIADTLKFTWMDTLNPDGTKRLRVEYL